MINVQDFFATFNEELDEASEALLKLSSESYSTLLASLDNRALNNYTRELRWNRKTKVVLKIFKDNNLEVPKIMEYDVTCPFDHRFVWPRRNVELKVVNDWPKITWKIHNYEKNSICTEDIVTKETILYGNFEESKTSDFIPENIIELLKEK